MDKQPLFLIVDDDNAKDQAAQLRQSLQIARLGGTVAFTTSPAEMLQRIRVEVPSLILLDHHWPEVSIDRVLEELRREAPSTRVVLYTGKQIDPSVIIDCARWGVAEYLMKGTHGGDLLAKKLSLLANDPSNTIEKLGTPSGAVQQLIQEAKKSIKELEAERTARRRLEAENTSLKSAERREIYLQVTRFVTAVVYLILAAALVIFANSTGIGMWAVVFCTAAALAGLMILDRSISAFVLKIGKSQFNITRKSGT